MPHLARLLRKVCSTLSLLVLASVTIVAIATAEDLKQFGTAPSFTLRNSENTPVSAKDLAGKVWIANFFFTDCEGPCPIQAAHLQKLADTFPETQDLVFVSITADPKNDTPEKLAAYAERIKADTSRWHFLTGDSETIHDLMNENGFALGSGPEPIYHSTRFVLVDQQGQIRGFYRGTEMNQVKSLITDIKKLL